MDDGSPTPPDAVVIPFRDRLNITLLTQAHAGPATARNSGAAHAKGTFLAFTDDDCAPASDWLQTLAARFAVAPDCAFGGHTLNALPASLYSTATQMLIDYLYTYYNADPNQAGFFASNNLALSADRFHAIGGFDPTFPLAAAEDREFCERWLRHGYRMIYAPEVLVYHRHPLTYRTFWKQHWNYGRGASYFHHIRARRGQGHIGLKPPAFFLDLLRYPFSQVHAQRALFLAALLVMAQGVTAVGFGWECVKRITGKAEPRP
jgi:GT2 family glycosyltransferase